MKFSHGRHLDVYFATLFLLLEIASPPGNISLETQYNMINRWRENER